MSTEGIMGLVDDIDHIGDRSAYEDSLPHATNMAQSGDVDWILDQMVKGRISPEAARQILSNSTTLALEGSRILKSDANAYINSIIRERSLRSTRTLPPYRFQFRNYRDLVRPVPFFSKKWNETAKTGMVVLPVPPETMEVSGGNQPEEVVAASGITYSHAGPYTPLTFSLEGFFPHITDLSGVPDYIPTDTIRRGLYSPAALCAKFTTAMRAGQPLIFSVVQPLNAEKLMRSHTVIVTDFTWSFRSGHGADRFWTMTLREWFPQEIIQTGRKVRRAQQGTSRPDDNENGRAPVEANRVYTVVTGDSLSIIADKKLGDRRRWREIYDLNKATIESEAKKRGLHSSAGGGALPLRSIGWWIFPGTKLKIPT